jgi:hypothetical protein
LQRNEPDRPATTVLFRRNEHRSELQGSILDKRLSVIENGEDDQSGRTPKNG